MVGRPWSPTVCWLGAVTVGVVANVVLWWPRVHPLLLQDCAEVRRQLMPERTSRREVRTLLGSPSVEKGAHWEYASLCLEVGSGTTADVAVLFRNDRVFLVVY